MLFGRDKSKMSADAGPSTPRVGELPAKSGLHSEARKPRKPPRTRIEVDPKVRPVQLIYPVTWRILAGVGNAPDTSGLESVLDKIINSYKLDAYGRSPNAKRVFNDEDKWGDERHENANFFPVAASALRYGTDPGVWWRHFASTPGTFGFVDKNNEFMKLSRTGEMNAMADMIRAKFPPVAWQYLAHSYVRPGFMAADEIASVMVNPHMLLKLSKAMRECVDSGTIIMLAPDQDAMPIEMSEYAKSLVRWTASFLGDGVKVNNLTAAPPCEHFYQDHLTFPMVTRARACIVPRVPEYSYSVRLHDIGWETHKRDKDLYLPHWFDQLKTQKGTQRNWQLKWLTDLYNTMRQLGYNMGKESSFDKKLLGLVPPEVLFGKEILNAAATVPNEFTREWQLLAALALDSLGPQMLIGRQLIAEYYAKEKSTALNFDPSRNVTGVFRYKDGTTFPNQISWRNGVLFTVRATDRVAFFSKSDTRVNMFNYGNWVTDLTERVHARMVKDALPTRPDTFVGMQRFLDAVAANGGMRDDDVANHAQVQAKFNAALAEFERENPGRFAECAAHMDQMGRVLALMACAIARCGMEVVVRHPPGADENVREFLFGGNPACALMQYNVNTRVVFAPTVSETSAVPTDVVLEAEFASPDNYPTLIAEADEYTGDGIHGRSIPLDSIAWKKGAGEDTIIAHTSGFLLDIQSSKNKKRSTDGKWGARWQPWKLVGVFDDSRQSKSKISMSVVILPWSADNDQSPLLPSLEIENDWFIPETEVPKARENSKIFTVEGTAVIRNPFVPVAEPRHVHNVTVSWNYFLRRNAKNHVEVYVSGVYVEAAILYWSHVWANTAGRVRRLYNRVGDAPPNLTSYTYAYMYVKDVMTAKLPEPFPPFGSAPLLPQASYYTPPSSPPSRQASPPATPLHNESFQDQDTLQENPLCDRSHPNVIERHMLTLIEFYYKCRKAHRTERHDAVDDCGIMRSINRDFLNASRQRLKSLAAHIRELQRVSVGSTLRDLFTGGERPVGKSVLLFTGDSDSDDDTVKLPSNAMYPTDAPDFLESMMRRVMDGQL